MCDGNCANCPNRNRGVVVDVNPTTAKSRNFVDDILEVKKDFELEKYMAAKAFSEGKAMIISTVASIEFFIPIKTNIDGVERLHIYEIISQMFAPVQHALASVALFYDSDIEKLVLLDDVKELEGLDIKAVRKVVEDAQKQEFITEMIEIAKEGFLLPENDITETVKNILAKELK